jgi:hypothetical protein
LRFEECLAAPLQEAADYLECSLVDIEVHIQNGAIRTFFIGPDRRVFVKDVLILREEIISRVPIINEPARSVFVIPLVYVPSTTVSVPIPIYYENALSVSTQLYYVYLLIRPDGRVFYVGKGTGKRVHGHEREARTGCACHKCCVIRKIWKNGGQVIRNIIFETHKEEEALQREAELIEKWRGILTNVASGERKWLGKRTKKYHWRDRGDLNEQELRQEWVRTKTPKKIQDDIIYNTLLQRLRALERKRKHWWVNRYDRDDLPALDDEIDWLRVAVSKLNDQYYSTPQQLAFDGF